MHIFFTCHILYLPIFLVRLHKDRAFRRWNFTAAGQRCLYYIACCASLFPMGAVGMPVACPPARATPRISEESKSLGGPKRGGAEPPPSEGWTYLVIVSYSFREATPPSRQCSGRQYADRLASGEEQERGLGKWLFCYYRLM